MQTTGYRDTPSYGSYLCYPFVTGNVCEFIRRNEGENWEEVIQDNRRLSSKFYLPTFEQSKSMANLAARYRESYYVCGLRQGGIDEENIPYHMDENSTYSVSLLTTNFNFNESESIRKYLEDQKKLAEVFSHAEAVALTVYIAVLGLFGMIANIVTFLVILKTPKLHQSAFYIILMSLCVSDFLSAVISPMILYRVTWGFYEWKISMFLCKFAIATDFWTSCCTIQHILIFALLRLMAVRFPHKFQVITTQHAKIAVFVLWLETFGVSFVIYFLWPHVFPPGQRTPSGDLRRACTVSRDWIGMLAEYVKIGIPIVFYIPLGTVLVVMLVLIVLMARRKLKRRETERHPDQSDKNGISKIDIRIPTKVERKERAALIQLGLIIASFLLGYIPDLTYKVMAASLRNQNTSMPARLEWQFFASAYCLLRLSECLNPIFYNLGSSNMKKATKRFLGIAGNTNRGSPVQTTNVMQHFNNTS